MKFNHRFIFSSLSILALLAVVPSCKLTELDVNTDPNNPAVVAPELLLPSVERGFVEDVFFGVDDANDDAHSFVGILATNDSYNLSNNSYNELWNQFYSGPAKDLNVMIKLTENDPNKARLLGVGQVLKAYWFGMMVDAFGDIPYSDAFKGTDDNPTYNATFDDDQAIYDDLLALCDQAVANLAKTAGTGIPADRDLFYAGNTGQWIRLANTVKLRLLLNARKVRSGATAEIQAILTADNYIKRAADDFLFRYNKEQAPDGRHPWYRQAYVAADNNFTYFLHQYMFEMLRDKDPRTPYYFRRQINFTLNPNDPTDRSTIPCSQTQGCQYGYWALNNSIIKTVYPNFDDLVTKDQDAAIGQLAGFFGRDRGDISGVPNDVGYRTAPGAYPAAGLHDSTGVFRGGARSTGGFNTSGAGNGIAPLITSWMVKFYQIEAILTLGVTSKEGTVPQLFEAAIREQLAKVEAIGLASGNTKTMNANDVNRYVASYLTRYEAASSNEAKLNVVLKQAWFSNLGNGFEVWNAFRRTGYPNDIQTPIARYRQFALRLPYPAQEITLNKNAANFANVPFDGNEGVFWDNLKFKF